MSNLKKIILSGSGWVLLCYGVSQILRFGCNLVLTRLLFPEAFGLSALITSLIIGLQMFSDVGIGPSIVQNKRGEEGVFLNTAWTIQIIRGIALYGCVCLLAYPFSQFYKEPKLCQLIMVSGSTVAIAGFNPMGFFIAQRNLQLKKINLIELGCQFFSIVTMIIWAFISHSVWAIVAGSLVNALSKLVAGYVWLPTIKHRLVLDRSCVQSLIRFGYWILLSTVLGFISKNADRLIMGKFLTIELLGVFSIASMISKVVGQAFHKISNQVLFPAYSKLQNSRLEEVRQKVKKIRAGLMIFFLPPLIVFVTFGSEIIDLFFDERYHEAGWMLQVLSIGWIITISSEIGPVYLACGDSFTYMKVMLFKATALIVSILLGGWLFGTIGVICGLSAFRLFVYPYQALVYKRIGLWVPKYDILGILGSFICITILFALDNL